MIETLGSGQPADHRELAKQMRSHPFVDGPTRKLVRSWIEREPPHQIPWTPLAKPLSACRVALVSSAGIARHDQRPFDQDLERRDPWWSDQSWRPIPTDTTEDDVGVYHLHIDPRFAKQDLDCVLPLRRLQELTADGFMGAVATTHYSFMGYILQPRQLHARAPGTVIQLPFAWPQSPVTPAQSRPSRHRSCS
jgi:D-proline reductase (dithiol) PrdB